MWEALLGVTPLSWRVAPHLSCSCSVSPSHCCWSWPDPDPQPPHPHWPLLCQALASLGADPSYWHQTCSALWAGGATGLQPCPLHLINLPLLPHTAPAPSPGAQTPLTAWPKAKGSYVTQATWFSMLSHTKMPSGFHEKTISHLETLKCIVQWTAAKRAEHLK